MIPLGTFAPDMAATNPGVALVAKNIIVQRDANGVAHGPMPGPFVSASATALPAAYKGGTSAVGSSGNYAAFIGTSSNLYKMSAIYELDASTSVGSGYSLIDGDRWSFARFGALLHATNTVDGLLQFDLDSDSAFSAVSGAPAARFIFPAFGGLFAGDCDGDNRIMRHSALGNSTIWSGKGAGYQEFEYGEALMAGAELSPDFAIVIQRNAVSGLFRRADGRLFDKRLIAKDRGAVTPHAFCSVDGRAFWCDTDGFWMFSQANGLQGIGFNRVNKTFLERLAADGLNTVTMAVDKVNTRIVISYRRQDVASETVFEDAFVYDYLLDEWSEAAFTHTAIMSMANSGYDTDSIDSFGKLDDIDTPVDSRFWAGGEPRLAALDGDLKFAFFDGDALEAVSETSSLQSPMSMMFRSITPLTDAENASIQIGVRDSEVSAITWKDGVAKKPSGRCPIRGRGKLASFRQTTAAGELWTYSRGFDYPEMAQGGPR